MDISTSYSVTTELFTIQNVNVTKMKYTIKPNDYVAPTEIREEVVQRLINYYIGHLNSGWNEFCPNSCWRNHHSIGYRKGQLELVGGATILAHEITDILKIRTCEMKEFFKVWLSNGYYISKGRYRVNGKTAILYKFRNTPYTDEGYRLVTEFDEDLDW
jgi:hypothetical protein